MRKAHTNVTDGMRNRLWKLLSQKAATPFRRSELSALMLPLTRPRSLERANELADATISTAHSLGIIVRHGHKHWIRPHTAITLKSGRLIPLRNDHSVNLVMRTRTPEKWLSVDLELGHILIGAENGEWTPAPASIVAELKVMLSTM